MPYFVSTHSRPKAAGGRPAPSAAKQDCFNTQPPEGGWAKIQQLEVAVKVSTHSRPKAAGARLELALLKAFVSTHSRPKAAGKVLSYSAISQFVSTHSRPKAAGYRVQRPLDQALVSTHSRPKAAGLQFRLFAFGGQCFNTQPPEGGWEILTALN